MDSSEYIARLHECRAFLNDAMVEIARGQLTDATKKLDEISRITSTIKSDILAKNRRERE